MRFDAFSKRLDSLCIMDYLKNEIEAVATGIYKINKKYRVYSFSFTNDYYYIKCNLQNYVGALVPLELAQTLRRYITIN